jgi:hypothetical protein
MLRSDSDEKAPTPSEDGSVVDTLEADILRVQQQRLSAQAFAVDGYVSCQRRATPFSWLRRKAENTARVSPCQN